MGKLDNVHLVNGDVFSGDEFLIATKDRILHLKLYLAECPPLSYQNKQDSLRIEYLSFYWGLTNSDTLLHFANTAREFTQKKLARPFTVYTKYQLADPGCDSMVYAFVKTATGEFLSYMLIENGLSCIQNRNIELLEISHQKRIEPEIKGREIKAILLRNGIWACTDPERLINQRSEIRLIIAEQKKSQTTALTKAESGLLKDINTATIEEIQIVKGIGPKTAAKIVASRPYQNMNDLLRVKGIGPKTLEKIKQHFVVQSTDK